VFEQLFSRPGALARHRDGPLVEERLRYLSHLAAQGLTLSSLQTAAQHLLLIAASLRLADRPGEAIGLAEIEQQAAGWANRPVQPNRGTGPGRAAERFLWHATQWLAFLGRLQPPPAKPRPHAEQIAALAHHLGRERGLSPSTIAHVCAAVEKFLDDLDRSGICLTDLTIATIDDLLLARIARDTYARRSVQKFASTLRTFFRYAHGQGWCPGGLAEAIQAPRVFPQESLPCGPPWQDVQRLLASSEGDRPTDIRDRAILLLLAVYGFRAGEVLRLRLEDFDWERQWLRVTRPKVGRTQVYPLARSVGDAVIRYLKEMRPRCAFRQVFLTRRAPVRPLGSNALWPIVARRCRDLGVANERCGPHALRHACATHLLDRGLSLKEMGDHLGHRHPDTTRIYTKVDLTGLRQVADFDIGGLLGTCTSWSSNTSRSARRSGNAARRRRAGFGPSHASSGRRPTSPTCVPNR
jgi:site-specific recombinase XerD